MRLIDLEPEWIKGGYLRHGVGIRFKCPSCKGLYLPILFLNPIDGGRPIVNDPNQLGNCGGNRWARSGTSFDDLTLSPSIDASRAGGVIGRPCTESGGSSHWHGFILDGEVR